MLDLVSRRVIIRLNMLNVPFKGPIIEIPRMIKLRKREDELGG